MACGHDYEPKMLPGGIAVPTERPRSSQAGSTVPGSPAATVSPPPPITPKPASPPYSVPIAPYEPFPPTEPARWIERAGEPSRPTTPDASAAAVPSPPAAAVPPPTAAAVPPPSPEPTLTPRAELPFRLTPLAPPSPPETMVAAQPEPQPQPEPQRPPSRAFEDTDPLYHVRANWADEPVESSPEDLSLGASVIVLLLIAAVAGSVLFVALQLLN